MDPSHFFAELKRRNVYKVAAAYAVVAWFLIQAASIVFPTFEAPAWTMKALIAAVAVGFPIALVLAWAFELTPEGFVRSEEVAAADSITRRTGRKLDFLIIAVLAAVIALLVADRFRRPSTIGSISSNSIAVLPFENLSRDPDNAFFADGIQDDILTSLAKISDLKVISRSSVMQYRGAGSMHNLGEIAKALGVENILEGSVRRVENRVLVTAQLITAHDGRHIWAERYDRTMADSLGLQGELAGEIAAALRLKLAPAVKASLDVKPTLNPDAYVFYLRGREYQMRPETSQDNYLAAENFYKQALILDPKFALAQARLSTIQNNLYGRFDPRPARKAEARRNAEEAVRSDPNCGQAHMALAMLIANENPERAKREVAEAIRLVPNDAYVLMDAAMIQEEMKSDSEAAASYERALVLNPREGKVFYNYGVLLYDQGDIPRSRWALDRALELSSESVYFRLFRARAEINWTGDVARGKAILAALPAGKDPDGRVTSAHCTIAMYERDFGEALRLLHACSSDRIPCFDMGFGPMTPKKAVEGFVHFAAGDLQHAYTAFDSVRPIFEAEAAQRPDEVQPHFNLALMYAVMGLKDAAKTEAERSREMFGDRGRAYVFAQLKDPDETLTALERAVAKSEIKNFDLRLDWDWDFVRDNPRFQKLRAAK
jgi:TolB-like protein/Flp pilus assembly protein TadD